MNAALRMLLLVFLGLGFATCQKEFSGNNPGIPENPPATNITASITGRITNELGVPVKGALVTAGAQTAMTDVDGVFTINNTNLSDQAAFVKVDKAGYFTGSRTFIARQGQKHYVEIQLLPKNNVGSISGTTGGTISLSNGSVITLPANGVVVQSSGAAYTGSVQVAMTWLDPTATNLSRIMPGDLRGIDESGNQRGLTSYGMIGVELTGTGGEKLQIATGKKASLKFPLPSATQSSAPATIALWSFNETTGLWQQEGTANKVGTNYEAQVSHFSFWNCDAPFLNVQFSATFKDQNGNPLKYKLVKLTRNIGSGWLSAGYGYTDSSGYVKGIIPQNETLLLEVFINYACTSSIYSQNIGPYATSSSANLGTVTVNIPGPNSFTVTGTANNCSGSPVTDGYVEVKAGYHTYRSPVVAGAFSLHFTNCSPTQQIAYFVVDNTTNQQSASVTTTVNSGNNALGVITACGTSTQQFINFTINGSSYNLLHPTDSLSAYAVQQGMPSMFSTVNGSDPNWSKYISFTFNGVTTGNSPLVSIQLHAPSFNDSVSLSTANPIMVNITEYGNIGGYMAGSFNGTLLGSTSATHTVQCNFRVRRQQ